MVTKRFNSKYNYIVTIVFLLVAYVVHKKLQQVYFQHCNSDLIHVILFSNSDFCVCMKRVLDIIEGGYWQLLRPLRKNFLPLL